MSWAVVTVAYAHRASRETTGTINRLTILARTVRGQYSPAPRARGGRVRCLAPCGSPGPRRPVVRLRAAAAPRVTGAASRRRLRGSSGSVRMASSLGTGSVRCRRGRDGRARRYRAVLLHGPRWAEADASRSPPSATARRRPRSGRGRTRGRRRGKMNCIAVAPGKAPRPEGVTRTPSPRTFRCSACCSPRLP